MLPNIFPNQNRCSWKPTMASRMCESPKDHGMKGENETGYLRSCCQRGALGWNLDSRLKTFGAVVRSGGVGGGRSYLSGPQYGYSALWMPLELLHYSASIPCKRHPPELADFRIDASIPGQVPAPLSCMSVSSPLRCRLSTVKTIASPGVLHLKA